jgi:glycosyltransferase involved in cell wall biosynthesis
MLAERIAELTSLNVEVEVVVVDNASLDDTPQVAAANREHFVRFTYVRNDNNLGIDGNIHRCSQLASGIYVQFLSDDDVLLPGALRHIVQHLLARPQAEFFFLNLVSFVNEVPVESAYEPRIAITDDLICTNQNQIVSTCGIWLTFLSSFVFRRAAWNRSVGLESYIGTDIYLSYALFDLLSTANESVVVARPLIAARAHFSGNYRIFYAFGYQWAELLLTHAPAIGFDARQMEATLRQSIRTDLVWRVLLYRLKDGDLTADERCNVFHGTRSLSAVYTLLWVSVHVPRILLRATIVCFKVARRFRLLK